MQFVYDKLNKFIHSFVTLIILIKVIQAIIYELKLQFEMFFCTFTIYRVAGYISKL